MDRKEKKKSYSDLEAIVTSSVTARQSYWNAKYAVPSIPDPALQARGANEEKATHDTKAIFNASPVDTLAPTPPAYFLVDSKGQTQALYAVPTDTPSETSSIVNFKSSFETSNGSSGWWKSLGEGRRICGMRKNMFLAVMAGLCALVLGLLITILIVTRPQGNRGKKDDLDGNGPIYATEMLLGKGDAGSLLAASNVAAMNWTTAGVAYTGVFYQSSSTTGAGLMVAIKNEGTQAWSTVNISASVTGKKLDVLPGTPLAAASNNGLWNLYYLTSSMTIEELYSTDPTSSSGWLQGEFAARLGFPEVMPSSGLGAMWQSCDDCDNALLVMWQNAQTGSLVYANMTNLTWGSSTVMISGSAAPGTPAAVSAFTDDGLSLGSDHNAVRFYWTQGNILRETLKGPLGNGNLVPGNNDVPIADNLSSNPPPTLASLTYGADTDGWTNNLLAWIDPFNGQLQAANFLTGTNWTVKEPTLDGSPRGLVEGGFSAVALTQDMKIYVLSPVKGEIHEYSTTPGDALKWIWQMTIDT